MIKVFQRVEFGNPESDLVLVAEVDTVSFTEAYRLTNSIDCPWWENEGVTPKFSAEGCRSTSVADVLEMDGTRVEVRPVGFVEVSS